ncbi:MAG: LamG domain-containing protein [Nanoarchaeota archaeon]
MLNKKGVSDVITTVLLILIVLAAIGIVWMVISNFLNASTEQISLGVGFSQLDIIDNSLKYFPNDSIQLRVKRDSNPGNITGLRVIVEGSNGETQAYDVDIEIKELETKTISVPLQGKVINITKVSIAPRTPINNKIKTGQIVDEEHLSQEVVPGEDPINALIIASLAGYWSFNNDNGNTVIDSSKNGNNGINTGATLVSGKTGSAYNFVSSSSSHISISDSDIFNFNPNFNYSYEFWIKPSTITEWNSVWTQQSSTNPNDFFIIYAQTTTDPGWGAVTKGISAGIGTGSANIFQRTKNNVIDVNNYYHIVITYNSSKVQSQRFNIFVNGTDQTDTTTTKGQGVLSTLNPATVWLGGNSYWGEYFNGEIDEVRVYNRTLTDQEVSYLYTH